MLTKKVFAAIALAGVALLSFAPAAHATGDNNPHKVWVCKYVGQPGDFETLKDGKQPIQVDVASADAFIGADFADGQNHSVVIDFVTEDNTSEHNDYTGEATCPTPATTSTTAPATTTTGAPETTTTLPCTTIPSTTTSVPVTTTSGEPPTTTTQPEQSTTTLPTTTLPPETTTTSPPPTTQPVTTTSVSDETTTTRPAATTTVPPTSTTRGTTPRTPSTTAAAPRPTSTTLAGQPAKPLAFTGGWAGALAAWGIAMLLIGAAGVWLTRKS